MTHMMTAVLALAMVGCLHATPLSSTVDLCPYGYVLNPYSNTCFRLVKSPQSWYAAKYSCEKEGEHLAVLDSVESINWFKNLRQTNSAWKSGILWLGGKKIDGVWKWQGRTTDEFLLADWEQIQPDGSGDCLQIFDGTRARSDEVWENYKWDDTTCSGSLKFVCEQS